MMAKSGQRNLTPKQKRFKEEYQVDHNATQAAIRAGYSKKTAYSQGQRLLKKAEIAKAIKAEDVKHAEKCEITRETIAKQLEEDRKLAHRVKQAGAAVAASSATAKLFGMMSDKIDHNHGGEITVIQRVIVKSEDK